MPVLNYAAELQNQAAEWRRHLHRHPELLYDVQATADFIAGKLRQFGVDEVIEGIGRTGVVGLIHGRAGEGRTIGLRADMDALPIGEETGRPWASTIPGKMHACGHDGHMAMLLGAAKYLAETRNFRGRVAVIFQPAEEGGGGGKAMIEDGLMDRFSIAEVYGMHNFPGLPVGAFAIRPGPIMAATDEFRIVITGRGGHAAQPHKAIDPIMIGSQIVGALQMIVSRSADPVSALVVSVTEFHAGFAHNVIPSQAELGGTVRSFTPENRDLAEGRIRAIAEGLAAVHGAKAAVTYTRNYPRRSITRARRAMPRTPRSRLPASRRSIPTSRRGRRRRIFPTCSRPGRAPSSFSAMATAPGCTTRTMISTTRRSPTAFPTGSASPKPASPPEPAKQNQGFSSGSRFCMEGRVVP